jgi:hypothetical protein
MLSAECHGGGRPKEEASPKNTCSPTTSSEKGGLVNPHESQDVEVSLLQIKQKDRD